MDRGRDRSGAMRAVGWVGGRPRDALAGISRAAEGAALFEMPGNHHNAARHPATPLLAVGHEAFDSAETDRVGGPAGIGLWDVADPATPERVTTLRPPTLDVQGLASAHNFGWRGVRLAEGRC